MAVMSAILFMPSAALAGQNSIGVGVQASPVEIRTSVTAGSVHKLTVQVYNTGTDNENVSVIISNLSHLRTFTLQPSWVTFDRTTVNLDSGQTADMNLTLTIPSGIPNGYYTSDIWARAVDPSNAGVSLGAGSSTLIEFKIGPGTVNFGQFLSSNGGKHLTKKQLRQIARENRKLSQSHAVTSTGNGIPGAKIIGVIVIIIGCYIVYRRWRHVNVSARPKGVPKSSAAKDMKNKHDAKQAQKRKNKAAYDKGGK